jgi:hypothetical protein
MTGAMQCLPMNKQVHRRIARNLCKVFGIRCLRPGQAEAVASVLAGVDAEGVPCIELTQGLAATLALTDADV